MAGLLAVSILLGVGFINDFVNPVIAQEGCISHPLPPDIVDRLVSAANIAISQSSGISCSSKGDNVETVDGHALATLALLQHSLSATKEDLSLTKVALENVSLTVNDLTAKTKNFENAKCKDGWFLFQNSCYFFSTSTATWQNGRQQCFSLGADYVKISSDAELTFILSIVVVNTWIGLNDLQNEGYMEWSSDGTRDETNRAWWFDGQPDNAGNNEDCVHIWFEHGRKLLNDHVCTNSFFYICEMKAEAAN